MLVLPTVFYKGYFKSSAQYKILVQKLFFLIILNYFTGFQCNLHILNNIILASLLFLLGYHLCWPVWYCIWSNGLKTFPLELFLGFGNKSKLMGSCYRTVQYCIYSQMGNKLIICLLWKLQYQITREKLKPELRFEPQTSRSLAWCYTNWVILFNCQSRFKPLSWNSNSTNKVIVSVTLSVNC